jgi:hypothetical protein
MSENATNVAIAFENNLEISEDDSNQAQELRAKVSTMALMEQDK